MSKPEIADSSEWRAPPRTSGVLEERPYRECPHCGRHKFRWKYITGLFILSGGAIETCSECKYVGDKQE